MKSKNDESVSKVARLERFGIFAAFMLFPILFLAAQLLHPNLFHSSPIADGKNWVENFRGQRFLHFAHALEFLCAPLLIIMAFHYKKMLRTKAPWLGFIGTAMAFIGALMLLGNKSALCLTISAFDTLPDSQLLQLVPGLDVMLRREGWMVLLWLLPLLPLGFAVIGVALFNTRLIPRMQSGTLIFGSLLLANPEIEVMNFIASILLALSLIPYAIELLKKQRTVGEIG